MLTCKVPWLSITLAANGDIKPCCVYKGGQHSLNRGDTLETAWKKLDVLREEFIQGNKPDRCNACWDREKVLGHSRRTWYDDKIQNWPNEYNLNPEFKLRHVDLNFGNTCNLKCRMCGSWGSTTWFKEEKLLNEINPNFNRTVIKSPTIIHGNYWDDKKEVFKDLERIDFKGGEPLMQEGMYIFLEYLVEWGYAENITIAYTTNGTQTPDRLKDLWPKFKKIKIIISVEGTGDLYEYIRGGNVQTIDELENNMYWYDKFTNIEGSFNTAIQIYNIFDLNNILEWFESLKTSDRWHKNPNSFKFDCLVTSPKYLDINVMPIELKREALQKLNQKDYKSLRIIKSNLLNQNTDENNWNLFIEFTKSLDKIRNTDITKVVTELSRYF